MAGQKRTLFNGRGTLNAKRKLCILDISPIARKTNEKESLLTKDAVTDRNETSPDCSRQCLGHGNLRSTPLPSHGQIKKIRRKFRRTSLSLRRSKLGSSAYESNDHNESENNDHLMKEEDVGFHSEHNEVDKASSKSDNQIKDNANPSGSDGVGSISSKCSSSVSLSDLFEDPDMDDFDAAMGSDSLIASLDEIESNYVKSRTTTCPDSRVENAKDAPVDKDINYTPRTTSHRNDKEPKDSKHAPSGANPGCFPGADQSNINSSLFGTTFSAVFDLITSIDENICSPAGKEQRIISDRMTDAFYGLPIHVKSILHNSRGIEKLYEWQDECLSLDAVQKRQNLIYSMPTSGGKTLVAEILIMRELLCHQRDALLILPYVSIVQEKVRSLSPFAVELSFHVEEYAASRGSIPPKKRRKRKSVYVATIEKANALVNSLIESDRIEDLGLVVVDELHMIGDGSGRGATLEICLTKLKFVSEQVQIIGMSATLGNIGDLQTFLKAEIFSRDFRPVELKEFVKLGDNLYCLDENQLKREDDEPLQFSRKIKHPEFLDEALRSRDSDHLLALVCEVIPEHSCLVFCATKVNCQNVALLLARTAPRVLKEHKYEEKLSLLKELKNNVNVVCPILKKTIPCGIAYHHSGLTMDERKLIEEAYSSGTLCLLCCTSTLAAGVNLPAKRVILRAPYVGAEFLTRSKYKQMVGRAGRAGIDSSGESITIVQPKDKSRILDLVGGASDKCNSSLLYGDSKGLRSLILTLIGLKICKVIDDIVDFVKETLFFVQAKNQLDFDLRTSISTAVTSLRDLGLVEVKQKAESPLLFLEATELGRGTFKGCLDVDLAPTIYKELKRGMGNLVLLNDLHLLYLCTPLDMAQEVRINWQIYCRQISRLKKEETKAAEVIGVPEGFVARKASGQRCSKNDVGDFVIQRFYLTLMLYQLMKEVSVWETASQFSIPRGFLQNLLNSTISFASLLTHFTQELTEFWTLKLLIEALVKKLSYTSSLELVPLMEVPGVKQARAKQLFKAGYHSLASLAWADPEVLMRQLENLPRKQARLIVSSAKMLLQEKAEALREEAEEMIAGPLNADLQIRSTFPLLDS